MVQGSSSDAARRARIDDCAAQARALAGLTRELDRIEDTKGVGAAYYAKLDQCTQARHALGDALRGFLRDGDREALCRLRGRTREDAATARALDQALGDDLAQLVDARQVRHELFAVPVMLPRGFASTPLSETIREALAQAWLRLNEGRDHDEDEVRITVMKTLFAPGRIERLDEVEVFAWLGACAAADEDGSEDEDGKEDDDGGGARDLRAGGGADADDADDADEDDEDDDPPIEHWDETPMALRYIVIHVATPPEWLDDDEAMPADDLRPYLPNFADLPKNHLDWSADARRALSRITRGHINVGFPDDLRAVRVSGRYFAQFWVARYDLHRQLEAIGAEDDVARIACSLHRRGGGAPAKPRLSMRISLLDDDGDLLAGHETELDGVFTLEAAQPLIGDLALALSIDEQTTVPGLHELPDDAPGRPLFHTASGWRSAS
ncbi:MAG: hypothetical protein QM674_01000 [Burkholderiaceae bacterium]